MLHIPLPIMCHLPRIRLRKRRSPPCSICFVFYIAFSTCGPLGTLFVSTKPSPDHRDTSCYGVYTTLSYRICIIHRFPIDSPTRHFLVGRKAGILTASRHHFLYFPRVFRIPSREMESEVVALEKVQESQESPARNPSLHLSQDMRLTQSQDMLDTVRLAEMLTSVSNLSQGDHPNSSLPFFRSDRYPVRSQELSANLTPSILMLSLMGSEKNRLASMGSVERSDSLYLGLIQHLGLSLSQQSQVPVEATDELM